MRISVVLSFFNEAENLEELISRLRGVFKIEKERGRLDWYEIIFINDASTDKSEEIILKELKKGDIKLVNMTRNFGVAPCVFAGFAQSKGDQIVYMDSDLQDPPELIHEMIDVWQSAPDIDVINTVRLSRSGEGAIKLFLTRIGYRILKLTSEVPFIENAGDYKMLSRRVVDVISEREEALPFVRGLVYWSGYKSANIYYHRDSRGSGNSKFNVIGWKVIFNFLYSAIISFSSAPLVFSLLAGAGAIMLSIILAIYALTQYIISNNVTSGWTSLIIAITFFSGVQLFSLGVVGTYLYSIHLNVKKRRLYIVKDVIDG